MFFKSCQNIHLQRQRRLAGCKGANATPVNLKLDARPTRVPTDFRSNEKQRLSK